jgi:DNA-binding beta-propeller fold protein YncE
MRRIPVVAGPSLLALDPTTDDVYVRSRGMLDRYGNSVSNGAFTRLDGHTGRVVHVWRDVQGAPTVPSLSLFRTGNGLRAYHLPSGLAGMIRQPSGNVAPLGYLAVDEHVGHIFGMSGGPTDAMSTFVTVSLHTQQVVNQVPLPGGEGIEDMVADAQSGRVALATVVMVSGVPSQSEMIRIFDARTGRLRASAQLQGSEIAMAIDGPAKRLLVFAYTSSPQTQPCTLQIFALDTLRPLATIEYQVYSELPTSLFTLDRPWDPEPIAVDTTIGRAIAINNGDQNYPTVQVIDVHNGRVLYTLPVGQQPLAVHTDSLLHRACVVNYQTGDVTVVDLRTGKQVADVWVGTGPSSLAVDAHTGEVFVANSGLWDNTVTMFPAAITQS